MRHATAARRFFGTLLFLALGLAAGCGGSGESGPPALTVAISPSGSPSLDAGQALNLTATLANDSTLAGVGWSVSGGGTLTASTTSSVTYNAPASVTAATNVTVTASSLASPTVGASSVIVVEPPPAVTSAGALANGTVNAAYSAKLAASGGAGTLTWSLPSGSSLPAGLTLSSAGTIAGTVTAPVTASFTVKVTDASVAGPLSATSSALSLTINPVTLAIVAPALANAIVNNAYAASAFTATGGTGAIAWSATGLPAGLSIGTSNGVISGTATTAATYASVVITATDSGSGAFQQSKSTPAASLTVYPVLTAGALAAITAVQNVTAISATATAAGGAGAISWSATGLPAGVTIAAGSGALSGTPSAFGSFTVTVTAKDAGTPQQIATATLALTVIQQLAVTAPALAHAVQGTPYTASAFTTVGGTGAVTWSATGLPAGLAIAAGTGVISGTPTTAGASANVVVSATDAGVGALMQTQSTPELSLTVIPTLALTTTTLPAGTVGAAYSTTLAATGGVQPDSWSATGLPAGLGLNSATGVISGTPTATNAGNISVTVTDAGAPQQTQTASLAMGIAAGTPVVATGALPAASINVAYSQTLSYNPEGQNGAATWAVSAGSLPAPFALNPATGVLSGAPTSAGGPFAFSVTVTVGGVTSASQALVLNVYATLAVTSPATLTSGTVGTTYSSQLQAAGGSGSGFTWSLAAGTLPAGLASLPASGLISFSPTTAGTFNFTVEVTDTASHTATEAVTLTINPAPPVITTATLPNANVNVAYNQQLADSYSGTGTAIWAVTGGGTSLTAAGLALSPAGQITGTPTVTGTASFTVTVTINAQTSNPQTLTIAVVTMPAVTTATLPPAYVNQAYSNTLVAAGGSGTGYTWSVTSGQSTLTALNLTLSSAGVLSGTPTTTESGSITVQVKDANGQTGSATFTVAAYTALSLPAPNPTSLPAATTGSNYTGTIAAAGGAPGYTWTVNGTALSTSGTAVALAGGLGLSVSNTGNNTLSVSGTPTTAGTVSFTAAVADSAGTSVGPNTYTVAVTTTYSVSGNVNLSNYCGGGSAAVAGATISVNTSPVQTVTTDSNGNFTLAGLANGTYTLTPSITGPSSVFYPATQSVTVNGSAVTGTNFGASLGYTVSGTIAYGGSQTGPIYIVLNNNNCGGNGGPGVTLAAAGGYTIRGVGPGSYTLQAWMDNLGFGVQNATNAAGSVAVSVTNANATGANATLADPGTITLATAPQLQGVSGINNGVVAQYQLVQNSNNIEQASSYTLQWSTSPTLATIAGSHSFKANGDNTNVWFLNSGVDSTLTSGSVYYFRLYATAGSATSPNSSIVGPITIGAPTGGNTITGTVTFAGTASGPLFTGFYDPGTGNVYGEYIANPISPQAYSVQVPNGANDIQIAFLDQNHNGLVDAGDLSDLDTDTTTPVTGPATLNLILANANSSATVTTQSIQSTGSSESYALNFKVSPGVKLPVAVALVSGPNVLLPMDIGACNNCGKGYQFQINLNSAVPMAGDSYGLLVTYSDGTSETLNASVSAVLDAFATNLAPTTGTSTSATPTFTWTDPASAGSYIYSFSLSDSNGNNIWQIPGQDANTNGFTSAITSITWGTDPTGGGSTATKVSLTVGATYYWQIQVQDSFGNTAVQQVTYIP